MEKYNKNIMKRAFLACTLITLVTGCSNNSNDKINTKINTISFGELKFDLPVVFEKDTENSDADMQFYGYNSFETKDSCTMYTSKHDYISKDLKEAVKEGLVNKDNINYTTKEINGNVWTIGTVSKSENNKHYYYIINHMLSVIMI